MDITAAVHYVQTLWRQVDGIRAAPDEPNDSIDPSPRVLTYLQSCEVDFSKPHSDSFAVEAVVIRSELQVSRTNIDAAVEQARAMALDFLQLVQVNPTLGGAIMLASPVRMLFTRYETGGLTFVGYRFEIECDSELTP